MLPILEGDNIWLMLPILEGDHKQDINSMLMLPIYLSMETINKTSTVWLMLPIP